MKKKLCMAMTAMMIASSVPVYGAESFSTDISHTFTAKVGTKEFTKDGEALPLDVAIYIKDGYTMLPLRTFMTAALEKATMHWENGTATVLYGWNIFTFDLINNKIMKNGTEIPVSGKMEIRDGRVFVPLRNWGNILQSLGYKVENGDITWDNETKLATIHAVEQRLDISQDLEKPTLSGEGKNAEFALGWTSEYDELESTGDGWFIAQTYPEENVGLGQIIGSRKNVYSLLNVKTGEVKTYPENNSFEELDNGWLLMDDRSNGNNVYAIIRGDNVIPAYFRPGMVVSMSENMILLEYEGKYGFCPLSKQDGEKIQCQYKDASNFSEGLAAVCVRDEGVWTDGNYKHYMEWGYINNTGKLVIDAKYQAAGDFFEGLAKVRTAEGVGYIDKIGNEVIPFQYKWGGYFKDGKTYVTDYVGKTWLIDKTGEKLKLIAEGDYVTYVDDSFENDGELKNGILVQEEIVDLPNGDHKHLKTYYDETGKISYETYLLKKELSEGLAPLYDKEVGKYGYVNEGGKWVIVPSFDKAEPFEEGYAIVANEITLADGTVDVEWGIIQHPEY